MGQSKPFTFSEVKVSRKRRQLLTFGIGWIGLAETLICLLGKHHGESEEAQELGYEIVNRIDQFCKALTAKHHLNFSNYATPGEGLAGRFTAFDVKKYGSIKDVTDHGYYTNSFHIPVTYPISMVDKLKIEGVYHKLCPAGHISYPNSCASSLSP